MIRVTVDLYPAGWGKQKFGGIRLGVIEISNDVLTSTETGGRRGSYSYRMFKKRSNRVFKEGRIENFPRKSYHVWNLVLRVLKDAAEKNGGVI